MINHTLVKCLKAIFLSHWTEKGRNGWPIRSGEQVALHSEFPIFFKHIKQFSRPAIDLRTIQCANILSSIRVSWFIVDMATTFWLVNAPGVSFDCHVNFQILGGLQLGGSIFLYLLAACRIEDFSLKNEILQQFYLQYIGGRHSSAR